MAVIRLDHALAAASTCRDLIGEAQYAFRQVAPHRYMPSILDRYWRSLDALNAIFDWNFPDPTLQNFRACSTPLTVLQLMEILGEAVGPSTEGELSELRRLINEIRRDAVQCIATSPLQASLAKSRKLIVVPGQLLPGWTSTLAKVEGACGQFDRLLPQLSLPADWRDPSCRKRADYNNAETARLTAETIFENLLLNVLPHCANTAAISARLTLALARQPLRKDETTPPTPV
jgi:hypothetical protein